jgi:beta-galactosidase
LSCFLVSSLAAVAIETSGPTSTPQSSAQSESRFAPDKMGTILYGAAYYPEYMPYDRLDKDVEMMQMATQDSPSSI